MSRLILISILLFSLVLYFTIKSKDTECVKHFYIYFFVGFCFVIIGSLLVFVFHDIHVLIDLLLIKKIEIPGASIFFGYGLILMSIMFLMERIFKRTA